MEHAPVVEKNNADVELMILAESIVEECTVLVTNFFVCAYVARAMNLLRNGKHPDYVRAEMRKVNGFADYGYDEP